ncbi:MAG: hypothetical protein JSR58_06110 [Verrucomicrobia bacterium]|nr:hypothetical protein [Verrucomicrobiota bacterium]
MKLYLNVEMKNVSQPSRLSSAAETFLQPYRYLFNGKSYEILDGQIIQEELSFPEKNYMRTAAAVVAFIPTFFAGVLLRFVENLFNINPESRALLEQFYARKVEFPQAPNDRELNDFYDEVAGLYNNVFRRIEQTPDIWNNEQIINDFSQAMEKGYQFMDLYFKKLAQECEKNPNEMKRRMIEQSQNFPPDKQNQQEYARIFFMFPLYYKMARGWSYKYYTPGIFLNAEAARNYVVDPSKLEIRCARELTQEQNRPYFNPTKPQYRWRELYNAFCDKLDAYGLREARDTRFDNYSRHDTKKVTSVWLDTTPT